MYIFAAFLAFVVIVSTQAAPKQPCVSPKMWEAGESCRIDSQPALLTRISYDAVNERIRILRPYDRDPKEIIILYKQHLAYEIVRSTGKCTAFVYGLPFPTAEIPRDATFVGKVYFGLENQGCAYLNYRGTFEREGSKGTYVTGVTEKGCAVVYSKVTLKGVVKNDSFFNITLGIKDPSVFTPPKSCDEELVPDGFNAWPLPSGLHC